MSTEATVEEIDNTKGKPKSFWLNWLTDRLTCYTHTHSQTLLTRCTCTKTRNTLAPHTCGDAKSSKTHIIVTTKSAASPWTISIASIRHFVLLRLRWILRLVYSISRVYSHTDSKTMGIFVYRFVWHTCTHIVHTHTKQFHFRTIWMPATHKHTKCHIYIARQIILWIFLSRTIYFFGAHIIHSHSQFNYSSAMAICFDTLWILLQKCIWRSCTKWLMMSVTHNITNWTN